MPELSTMDVRIENRSDVEVVYAYGLGPYPKSAPKAWNTLIQWQQKNGLMGKTLQAIGFGMDHPNSKPDKLIRYIAAAELCEGMEPDEKAGIDVMTIPGGVYGVHSMFGTYQKMPETFQRLQTEWIPASGRVIDFSRPFLELYMNNPAKTEEADLRTDLCLPLLDE